MVADAAAPWIIDRNRQQMVDIYQHRTYHNQKTQFPIRPEKQPCHDGWYKKM